jgi:restriction system protein
LLPQPYVVFGWMGATPFAVIAVMVAWRQRHLPSPGKVTEALTEVAGMSWPHFSQRLVKGFAREGYQLTQLNESAADFLLTKAGVRTLVSCKRWKAANHGVEGFRELHAAKEVHAADQCQFIGLGVVSATARQFATTHKIQLMSQAELARLLIDK